MKSEKIKEALHRRLAVATGCTEPVAIAYAGAIARSYIQGEIKNVTLVASTNIIKNAFVVGIPGTSFTGLKYAVAVGLMCTEPERKLAVLESLEEGGIEKAKMLVESGRVDLIKSDADDKFYIEVSVVTNKENVSVMIIGSHTNVSRIVKNGKVIHNGGCHDETEEQKDVELEFDLKDVYEYCTTVEPSELELIEQAIELNCAISREGLENGYGLEVGRMIRNSVEKNLMADDITNYAMMLAAAASDARMAGVCLPVMSNSGSGNQGIAATMPVYAVWEKTGNGDREQLIRACALSNLTTIYIKEKFGVLSALCGAVVAGSGSACGITYLLGGTFEQIENAVHNTLGNVSGMICDGAKGSCALKISTCTNAAMQASLLALSNLRIKSNEGIVEELSEDTIDNLVTLGNEGSGDIDKLILSMIINKEE